ncbi:MAG TPA: DUF3105 domain-containing protein [Anaerolineae bacterium]|nr:DUF3105 domain-containing protein [Anaerolineae bacterium]
MSLLLAACSPTPPTNNNDATTDTANPTVSVETNETTDPSESTSSGSADPTVDHSDRETTASYHSNLLGLEVDYPANWFALEQGAFIMIFSDETMAQANTPDGPYGYITITSNDIAAMDFPTNPTSQDIVDFLNEKMLPGMQDAELIAAPATITVADAPGAQMIVRNQDDTGQPLDNTFTLFILEDQLLLAYSSTPTENIAEFNPIFNDVINSAQLKAPDLSLVEGITLADSLSRSHNTEIDYSTETIPPMGGVHHPSWQNCGIYDKPVEAKHVLHSLEHGAVWLAYQPDIDADALASLQAIVADQSYVVMAPYPNLSHPVVLTAWGVQLTIDDLTDSRIAEFVEKYQEGPQTPEPGATCGSGVGRPIEK